MRLQKFAFIQKLLQLVHINQPNMPKQVTLKSGEIVTAYTLEESEALTTAYIYEQAEILRQELRAARVKHEKNIREQKLCVM